MQLQDPSARVLLFGSFSKLALMAAGTLGPALRPAESASPGAPWLWALPAGTVNASLAAVSACVTSPAALPDESPRLPTL